MIIQLILEEIKKTNIKVDSLKETQTHCVHQHLSNAVAKRTQARARGREFEPIFPRRIYWRLKWGAQWAEKNQENKKESDDASKKYSAGGIETLNAGG